ncbi:Fe-S cluster assembly protein SufB [Lacticaseibacillus thailandensis]|uniref:Fe-S cluster assembly ABC-type transport system, permease component n=1 Tax=Lacticaseibacillus thailandensis DSM 22698 = JCM 13996 TaxID=1423810 RepID=A0A0R2C6Y7_9LACO|nr:Fe-S cluster assembly protein SufB [Lacticaseibacillus thailandensis]KRM86981.1 Fe-S cluster assembly ABC-type transport system, permease component [Lacticaseibacillus thailandensis DSM 22698 = JCM 13996]
MPRTKNTKNNEQVAAQVNFLDEDATATKVEDTPPLFSTGRGLTEDIVRAISRAKDEPAWMLAQRLRAFHIYERMAQPGFGPDLSGLDLDRMRYYEKSTDRPVRDWADVPAAIKDAFEQMGVPQAERKYLAGASAQYESEVVYGHLKDEIDRLGIVFTSMDQALREHEDLVHQYFGTLVPPNDNKYAALNAAVWSGGTFLYVPAGVYLDTPLQAFFRINAENMGQFERTLIIVEPGAHVNYVEGCTAPTYSSDSLHAAVVEVFVKHDAYARYTTIQNWSNNVYSLETKRASAAAGATMEWVDGNLGSKVTMKYPSVYLNGEGARGTMLSIAVAGHGVVLDSGARMIHNAPNTSSSIISKSIAKDGGATDYRGTIRFGPHARGAFAHVECDTILMDEQSRSNTIPINEIHTSDVTMEHEAKVSKVSEAQLYYLMSRGLTEQKATEMIIMGFVEPFAKELPMEYAVELNRLIGMSMAGSVG